MGRTEDSLSQVGGRDNLAGTHQPVAFRSYTFDQETDLVVSVHPGHADPTQEHSLTVIWIQSSTDSSSVSFSAVKARF